MKKQILEGISPLIPFLLTYLVISTPNNLLPIKARLAKKTRITKEIILSNVGDKNKVIAMTLLQQVLMLMSSRRKRQTSSKSSIQLPYKGILLQEVPSKLPKRVKKPISVLVTFTPVTATRKEVVEIAETIEAVETIGVGEDGKKSKSGEYPGNLARVLYIWYPITFGKKFVSKLALLD